jgi:hypothetical protein
MQQADQSWGWEESLTAEEPLDRFLGERIGWRIE